MKIPVIESQTQFDQLITRWRSTDRIALDTEFHRERTYFPRLALVQIADSIGTVVVDPLLVDTSSLRTVWEGDVTVIFHAAQQDMEVLHRLTGATPPKIIDTQLLAGFLGYSTPSLANLVNSLLGKSLPKGDRLTDWFARPLSADQISYAASDVVHLLELTRLMEHQLMELGRLDWAIEACTELANRSYLPIDPSLAWLRLKDIRTLTGVSRSIAQCLAMWREQRAQTMDVPNRLVLSDLGILTISQRKPSNLEELLVVRGVDSRAMKGKIGSEILKVIQDSPDTPIPLPTGDGDDIERRLRPAVTLALAWIGELAKAKNLDSTLVATKSDVISFLRGSDKSRLSQGWRRELVGQDLLDLLAGNASLGFDGKGSLRILRSNPPLGTTEG